MPNAIVGLMLVMVAALWVVLWRQRGRVAQSRAQSARTALLWASVALAAAVIWYVTKGRVPQ